MTKIFSIAPDQPFLANFVAGLLDRYGERLSDALILLPSRRTCLGVRDAFLDHCGADKAMLLPRLQPVADAGSDELAYDFAVLDIEPAIDPLRRQLLLGQLVQVQRRVAGESITDEHAIRLAADLASFLDEMQTEEIAISRLHDLVSDELAVHWQQILTFLQILGDQWPAILKDEECVDPAQRRRLLLDQTIQRWNKHPSAHPIIAAGITATIPAVARLLACVHQQAEGTIILPGLDRELDEESWEAIGSSPTHPQYGLHRLLALLEVDRSDVDLWHGECPTSSRTRFLSDLMRPAKTSDFWQGMPAPEQSAFQGLECAEIADFASEAELLSLRMRHALEKRNHKVALVTSDRTLGRRVAAELARFDIDVDDSAGTPLDQTPPGSFLLLAARALVDGLPPVPLLSLTKHPLATGGMESGAFRRYARALEQTVLRGLRKDGGFDALRIAISDLAKTPYWTGSIESHDLLAWLGEMDRASTELQALAKRESATYGQLIDAHLAFTEWLATDQDGQPDSLWAKEAGQSAASFMDRLRTATADLDPIAVTAYPALLAVLMGSVAVYPQAQKHHRAVILGQLESRLHQSDTVLIGGLNEGVWPRPPEPSPWLNRSMRHELGLPPAEQQIGIAAHDFTQAASAPKVLLSRSRKDAGGSPTTPSRWLARLDAVLRAKHMDQVLDMPARWYGWVGRRITADDVQPTPRPEPCPPTSARPRKFWVTDIEMMMRNPYQFYARRILNLRELEPLDAEPGAAERGQIVHAILETFVRQFPSELPDGSLEILLQLGRKHFASYASNPQVRAIWWPRFIQIAEWFLDQERARRNRVASVLAERTGEAVFASSKGDFSLMARADRIELGPGSFNVIDYKTGQIPKSNDVVAGLKPQLPLTALIAQAGGFKGVDGLNAAELLYWGLKGGAEPGVDNNPLARHDVAAIIEDARAGIARLVEFYDDPTIAYPAVPRPEIAGLDDPFDQLARNKEWQSGLAVRGDGG